VEAVAAAVARDPVFCRSARLFLLMLGGLLFFFSSLQLDYVVAFLLKILPSQPEV
jgi:hypothetical protein